MKAQTKQKLFWYVVRYLTKYLHKNTFGKYTFVKDTNKFCT